MADVKSTLGDRESNGQADPERYAVRCPCGHVLEGQRETTYQRLPCPECGEAVFVLPRNARPHPRAGTLPRNDFPQSAKREAGAMSPDLPAPAFAWPSPRRLFAQAMASLRERLWRWRRRAALAVFVLAVAGTLTLAWRIRQREHYAALLNTATRDGRAALVEGDWKRAVDLLGDADRAARGLAGDSTEQRLAKQLYREADVWYRLGTRPLYELTELLAAAPDEQSLRREFQRQFAGRTVILDTRLSREATWAEPDETEDADDEHASPPLLIEWQLCDEVVCVTLRVEHAAIFDWIQPGEAHRAMFGAELHDIRAAGENRWEVELDGASCTLITLAEPLAELAWQTDEELVALLAAQRQRAGIEP